MRIFFAVILFPLSIFYGLITWIRNLFFDAGILKSVSHKPYIISVGNLRAGGTGKTPFVEYLLRNMPSDRNPAVISRGYGRKTKGYRLIKSTDTALNVGDEPLQMYKKFPQIPFAVSENRNIAVQNITENNPQINTIILDDAFQHRYIKADFSILLTPYIKPFFKDFVLPFGMLREYGSGYKRADLIVVTKCSAEIFNDITLQKDYINKIKPLKHQSVLFSKINYKEPYRFSKPSIILSYSKDKSVILLSAIADNKHIYSHLIGKVKEVIPMTFPDHHNFTSSDIEAVKQAVKKSNAVIITTEKDAVRLDKNTETVLETEIYVLGIEFLLNNNEFNFYKKWLYTNK